MHFGLCKKIIYLLDNIVQPLKKVSDSLHYLKNVQIRSYFWSVFSCIRTEYGPEITLYLDIFHEVLLRVGSRSLIFWNQMAILKLTR